jgi:hypothetical protein
MIRQPKYVISSLICSLFIILAALYTWSYASHWPIWFLDRLNIPVAAGVKSGTLSPGQIFAPLTSGHRLVFAKLTTVLFTYLTNWNLVAEAFVTILILAVNFLILLILFRRLMPRWTWLAAMPFAALLFAVRQEASLTVGFHTTTFHPFTFLLAGLLALLSDEKQGWRPVVASVCIVCGAVSHISGLLVGPLLIGAAWLLGYRRVWHYTVLLLSEVLAIALMTRVTGRVGVGTGPNWSLLDVVHQFITTLGGPLVHNTSIYYRDTLLSHHADIQLAFAIGAGGLLVFALNAITLYLRPETRKTAIIWITVAGLGIGTAAMIAIGRGEKQKLGSVPYAYLLQFWYATLVTPFWIGLSGLISAQMVWLHRQSDRSLQANRLFYANYAVAVILIVLYARANILSYQVVAADHGHGLNLVRENEAQDCLMEFPITRTRSCWPERWSVNERIYQLEESIDEMAIYKLGVFGAVPDQNIIHSFADVYVFIETPDQFSSYRYNRIIQSWELAGIPDSRIIRIIPGELPKFAAVDTSLLLQDASEVSVTRLSKEVGDHNEFWHVFPDGSGAIGLQLIQKLCPYVTLESVPSEVEGLTLRHYQCGDF